MSTSKKHIRFGRPQVASDVLAELRRRGRRGQSLASGANRGDWLYAAALRFFGNWGAAVEAAGFHYGDARRAALSKEDVLRRLHAIAKDGLVKHAEVESVLRSGAARHFGSVPRATAAAGLEYSRRTKWSRAAVLARIAEHVRAGRPVTSVALIGHDQPLYGAGRKVFGSWAAALASAKTPRTKPRARPGRRPR
jgi:hypothetical protein